MFSRRSQAAEFEQRFPGLATVARKYVSSHYDHAFATPKVAVLAFLRAADRPTAQSALDGVEALLTELSDEQAREKVLRAMRFGYAPKAGGLDEFLRWMRSTLRQHMATSAKSEGQDDLGDSAAGVSL